MGNGFFKKKQEKTTLYLSGPNLEQLISKVNSEFKKIVDYFRFLKLALHPDKTKFILFTNNNEARLSNVDLCLNFNNSRDVPNDNLISKLVRVTADSPTPHIKFLGIHIDPLLTFKLHINTIVSKVSKAMFFLRSVKNVLTGSALKSVYYALIHSHFVYGIHIWSCTNQSNLNSLFLKQKTAIRLINSAKYNAHTEPIFKSSGILPLYMLTDFFKLKFFHDFVNKELPTSFDNTWIRNEDRRIEYTPVLRNHQEFHIPPSRLNSSDKFPLASFPRIWLSFPDKNIKNTTNKISFNRSLKEFFLNKLNSTYVCTRLLCPHCHLRT